MPGAPGPDPDDQADKYEVLLEVAAGLGSTHYEVSNFATPGHACRYNLATWAQGEYVAFGLGAHGHRGGVRRRNRAPSRRVPGGGRQRSSVPRRARECSNRWDREQERVILGLRRVAGVVAGSGGAAFAASQRAGSAWSQPE